MSAFAASVLGFYRSSHFLKSEFDTKELWSEHSLDGDSATVLLISLRRDYGG